MKLSAWITDELIHSGWVDEKERALYEYSWNAVLEMGANIIATLA